MNWSYSMYSAAVKCMKYYKLVYIDKIDPGVPESGDLLFGSALHSALNACLTGEDAQGVFSIYWDSYKNKEITYGRFNWEALKILGENFISKFERLHANKYKLLKAEERYSAEYKGIIFDGTPDFIGDYNASASLRDFKTSGYNYAKEKSKVALQLNLYAYLAIKNLDWKPKTLGYTVFNKGMGSIQDLTWDFCEETMYRDLDNLLDYCELFNIKYYPANINSCIMGSIKCSYFNHCHGGQDESNTGIQST